MATILIVDDEPAVLLDLEFALQGGGNAVIAAGNGLAAMELLRHNPAVAVIDLMLPKHDGIEVIRAIKQVLPGTRIIAITGAHYDDFDALAAAMKLGADAGLRKPIVHGELQKLVTHMLASGVTSPSA